MKYILCISVISILFAAGKSNGTTVYTLQKERYITSRLQWY